MLNGNPLPYALLRVPQKNEVRANLAKGGKGILKKDANRGIRMKAFFVPTLYVLIEKMNVQQGS